MTKGKRRRKNRSNQLLRCLQALQQVKRFMGEPEIADFIAQYGLGELLVQLHQLERWGKVDCDLEYRGQIQGVNVYTETVYALVPLAVRLHKRSRALSRTRRIV